MGRVILCETRPAKTSYIFPNTKIEVFSYEELCYYIYNNIALISEEYIGVPLFIWIRNELGLSELADVLYKLKEKETSDLTDLLTAILTYREYYSIPEVKDFILKRERIKNLDMPKLRKLQADGFLRYHKYLKALSIYDEILEQNPLEKGEFIKKGEFFGAIYHNRGVALANNFELEAAVDSYLKSYELTGNKKSIYEYLLIMATMKDVEDIKELASYYHVEELVDKIYDAISDAKKDVAGSPVYHRVEKAIYHYEKNNLTDFSKQLDTVIEKLKEEFRGQME